MGMTHEAAAAYAGITRDRLFAWMRDGASETARADVRQFHDRVKSALDQFEAKAIEVIARYALEPWNGVTTTMKTIKDKDGKTVTGVEVTRKTEEFRPDVKLLQWLLERRRHGYTPKQEIEHSQRGESPIIVKFVSPDDDDSSQPTSSTS